MHERLYVYMAVGYHVHLYKLLDVHVLDFILTKYHFSTLYYYYADLCDFLVV